MLISELVIISDICGCIRAASDVGLEGFLGSQFDLATKEHHRVRICLGQDRRRDLITRWVAWEKSDHEEESEDGDRST